MLLETIYFLPTHLHGPVHLSLLQAFISFLHDSYTCSFILYTFWICLFVFIHDAIFKDICCSYTCSWTWLFDASMKELFSSYTPSWTRPWMPLWRIYSLSTRVHGLVYLYFLDLVIYIYTYGPIDLDLLIYAY